MADNSDSISILRPDDLLALTFELVNLKIDQTQSSPRLVRTTVGQDAFLVVHFPPQHIAEPVFTANGDPSTVPGAPVMAVLAGDSRLAFRIPSATESIPLTLDALLDWASYEFQVPSNALPDLGVDTQIIPLQTQPPRPHEPAPNETAIEMPYRIILSPDASAGWTHALQPVRSPEGLVELWNTRLASAKGLPNGKPPVLRAVWTPDLAGAPPSPQFSTLPNPDQRQQIVLQSSDFGQVLFFRVFYVPRPIQTEKLILSALGGWIDASGSWQFPSGTPPSGSTHPPFDVTQWRHIAGMGRDQYVRVVTRGAFWPGGHLAALVEVAERSVARGGTASTNGEYMIARRRIVALEQVKNYDLLRSAYASAHGEGGEMPLRQLSHLTVITPELTTESTSAPFLVQDASGPVPFHYQGSDWEGKTVDFSLNLLFVPEGASVDSSKNQFTADLRGQSMAFANSSDNLGATTLPALSLTLSAQDVNPAKLPLGHPPFLPVMTQASVNIPAIDRLLGSTRAPGPQVISLSPSYLANGLAKGDQGKEVFAQLDSKPVLDFPVDKTGGLVNPKIAVTSLSRVLGPIPDPGLDLNSLLAKIDGKLIGGISLSDVLNTAAVIASSDQLPSLVTRLDGNSIVTQFHWEPRVRRINDPKDDSTEGPPLPVVPPIVTTASTTLKIDATAVAPLEGGSPSVTVTGTLSNFGLLFMPGFEAVVVTFDELTFTAVNGSKPELHPRGVNVEFVGPLSFVNTLSELLPSDGFDDPPTVSVTEQGITVGYTLSIPAAGAGVLSLQDIAISAALALPFDGRPVALELGFSTRFHPFLVTVSFIGGEGYLAVGINTSGVELVEGSLGLGGNLTLGLGIVEANAHVMGGLFFHWDGTQMFFTAYLRAGASVEVLGIVGIAVEIYLGLSFMPTKLMPQPLKDQMIAENVIAIVGGIASVTVAVHLLFVSKDLTFSLERQFKIPASAHLPLVGDVSADKIPLIGSFAGQLFARAALKDPTFDDTINLDDWRSYCQAFA
jgi:hypothetical protein